MRKLLSMAGEGSIPNEIHECLRSCSGAAGNAGIRTALREVEGTTEALCKASLAKSVLSEKADGEVSEVEKHVRYFSSRRSGGSEPGNASARSPGWPSARGWSAIAGKGSTEFKIARARRFFPFCAAIAYPSLSYASLHRFLVSVHALGSDTLI